MNNILSNAVENSSNILPIYLIHSLIIHSALFIPIAIFQLFISFEQLYSMRLTTYQSSLISIRLIYCIN